MNTKTKQHQKKNQRQKTGQEHGPKKLGQNGQRGRNTGMLHEHESPEMRLTR